MKHTSPFIVAALLALGLVVPGAALAGTVTGTVTDGSGSAADDARVVVTDLGANLASSADDVAVGSAVTSDTGTYSVTSSAIIANEQVLVTIQDAGSAVKEEQVQVDGSGNRTLNASLIPSGDTYSALEIFGAQISGVRAGGSGCEFYASTSVIPQIFATTDCGNSWTAATSSRDSSTDGLDAS